MVQAGALPVWLTLNNSPAKKDELLLWLPKGVIVKIKGNIISFNPEPMTRVVIFSLALPVSFYPRCIQPFYLQENS